MAYFLLILIGGVFLIATIVALIFILVSVKKK